MSRDHTIDYTKGLLTLGMVFAHVAQFAHNDSLPVRGAASVTNLVSFSGFLFCFGYASWKAYLSKPEIPWGAVLKTAAKCWIAFVISGVAYLFFVESAGGGKPLNTKVVAAVAAGRLLPGYSEFLLSFAYAVVLGCLLRPVVRWATSTPTIFAVSVAVLWAAATLPIQSTDPTLAALVGGHGMPSYPLLPYGPLFLAGVYWSRHRPALRIWALAGAALALIAYVALTARQIKFTRFPPSLPWLVFSAASCYVYYNAGQLMQRAPRVVQLHLSTIGQNVLFYLLLSNLALFTAASRHGLDGLSVPAVLAVYVVLVACIHFLLYIASDHRSARRSWEPVRAP